MKEEQEEKKVLTKKDTNETDFKRRTLNVTSGPYCISVSCL
jgi:hypothetical protein